MSVHFLATACFILSLLFGWLPFWTDSPLVQSLYFSVASAFFSVFLALVAVNVALNSRERRQVAAPLLRLIVDQAQLLHNELFIQLGRDTFGRDRFNELIDLYKKHKGSPDAFSPEDLEKLYGMITRKKAEISDVYSSIEASARDAASILGWGYDPTILRAVLMTRSEILRFKSLLKAQSHDLKAKRELVESYFDIDASSTAWVSGLAKKVGAEISDRE